MGKEISNFEEKDVFQYFRKKKKYLEKILAELKKKTYEQNYCLKTEKRNSFIQYVVYERGNIKKIKYIKKSNLSLAKSIAQRDYEKQVINEPEPSNDCERILKDAGFPSSYWAGLCALKETHPNWKFTQISTSSKSLNLYFKYVSL